MGSISCTISKAFDVIKKMSLTVSCILFLACTQAPVHDSQGQTYPSSGSMADGARRPAEQPYYPADNDSDYVPPRAYVPPSYPQQEEYRRQQLQYQQQQQQYQQQQQQYQQQQQQQYQQPATPYYPPQQPYAYPQDNDSEYVNPYGGQYPSYNPDEDNSGYYYQPNKRLPPKKKSGDEYNYPIYFD